MFAKYVCCIGFHLIFKSCPKRPHLRDCKQFEIYNSFSDFRKSNNFVISRGLRCACACENRGFSSLKIISIFCIFFNIIYDIRLNGRVPQTLNHPV